MKNSLNLLVALLLLLQVGLPAQQGVEKTLRTYLKFESRTNLVVDFNGQVEVFNWNKDYVGIQMEVATNIEHENVLALLVSNDRYFVDADVDASNMMTIRCPHLKKIVTVNRKPLKENIRYTLYVPEYIRVIVLNKQSEYLAFVNTGER